MGSVLRFTLVMGPLSSLFDLATFILLRVSLDANVQVFRTAWFVESILTQILVIFIIRTGKPFWASRPHPVLTATSLGALAVALGTALTPLGEIVGFVPLPLSVLGVVAGVSVVYLATAETMKRVAISRYPCRRLHRRR
jgi:Mg2+-importing ATPase